MIRKLVAIVVLVLVLIVLLPYVKKTEAPLTTAPEPTNFVEEGILTFEPTGAQDRPYLSYKSSDDAPTTTVEIMIDAETVCAAPNGALPCMAMSSLYSNAFGGKNAVVEGVERNGALTAKVIRIIGEFRLLYPGPGVVYIPWAEAVRHIENCEAALVMQLHNLNVNIELKDGAQVTAVEPVIDEVFQVTQKANPTCGVIPIATE